MAKKPKLAVALDARRAAECAAQYLKLMMPQAESALLEEVDQSTEGDQTYWLITLSFQQNLSGLPSNLGLQFALNKREYKTFKIDASTGEVISMKIKSF